MTDFATWWYTEGSATPIPGDDGEEHLKRMCQIAWSNGAEVERVSMTQLFTDPENQPTQHGTVTVEYMQREIADEREACALVVDKMLTDSPIGNHPRTEALFFAARNIRARGQL